MGVVKVLNWEENGIAEKPPIFAIPPTSVRELALQFKTKLAISTLRVVGNLEMNCRRVGMLLGAAGGRRQIEVLRREDVDVLVCGEINEWETCEYVRDAVAQGREKALIVLGHAKSEEAGMEWLGEWLRPKFPGISIAHVPVGDPFHFM